MSTIVVSQTTWEKVGEIPAPEARQAAAADGRFFYAITNTHVARYEDLGDAGGSMTWAVRREGHWWCNFARYGADNARTSLVKYDDSWRERGRWTYPPEIFRELHDYSFSGGVWRGDSLLVTGH